MLWRGSTSAAQPKCRGCRNPTGHGATGYHGGCRCAECREGARLRVAAYVEKYRQEHGVHPSTASRKRSGWNGTNNRDFWIAPKKRYAIYDRDDWTCGLCGGPTDREWTRNSPNAPTLDHIIPRSRGGSHNPENLTTAHAQCNAIRQDRDFTEFIIWMAMRQANSA